MKIYNWLGCEMMTGYQGTCSSIQLIANNGLHIILFSWLQIAPLVSPREMLFACILLEEKKGEKEKKIRIIRSEAPY